MTITDERPIDDNATMGMMRALLTLAGMFMRDRGYSVVVEPSLDADWTDNVEEMASAVIEVDGKLWGITLGQVTREEIATTYGVEPRGL